MTFDASRPYRLNPAVTLRPEPFGALAYDFGRRRLTYLGAADLVDVVTALPTQPSAAAAIAAAGVPDSRRPAVESALDSLVRRGVLDAG